MGDDYVKELFYVDYCNCCKDLDIMSPNEVPCHHPWYCHMDKGEVQSLEYTIAKILHDSQMRGYMCSYEYEKLKELKNKKFNLIPKKLKEYRKNQRRYRK